VQDINRAILVGRLTREAEVKYTQSGTAICKFSIAVNRRKKEGDQWTEEANFFDVLLWGRAGEALAQYLTKGKQVAVEGELRQNRWQDSNGQNRSKVEINATSVQLLGGRDQSPSSEEGYQRREQPTYGAPQQSERGYRQPPAAPKTQPFGSFSQDGFEGVEGDDDIPF